MAPEALPKAARTIVASLSLFIASFLVLVFAILSRPMARKKEPRFGRRALSTNAARTSPAGIGSGLLHRAGLGCEMAEVPHLYRPRM